VTTPTAAEIRERSQVDFGTLGYEKDEELDRLIASVVPMFTWITGRTLDAMPPELEEAVTLCIERMVAVLAYQEQPEQIATISDFLVLSSFSAGSYSESRRSLTELKEARMISGDPVLNGMLLGLMDPERLDFWLAWWDDENAPFFAVTEVAWGLTGVGVYRDDVPWLVEPIINLDAWSW
jgi:hypothetical protein